MMQLFNKPKVTYTKTDYGYDVRFFNYDIYILDNSKIIDRLQGFAVSLNKYGKQPYATFATVEEAKLFIEEHCQRLICEHTEGIQLTYENCPPSSFTDMGYVLKAGDQS